MSILDKACAIIREHNHSLLESQRTPFDRLCRRLAKVLDKRQKAYRDSPTGLTVNLLANAWDWVEKMIFLKNQYPDRDRLIPSLAFGLDTLEKDQIATLQFLGADAQVFTGEEGRKGLEPMLDRFRRGAGWEGLD